jgi:hypothetical protein
MGGDPQFTRKPLQRCPLGAISGKLHMEGRYLVNRDGYCLEEDI